jgi:hypothetical protein
MGGLNRTETQISKICSVCLIVSQLEYQTSVLGPALLDPLDTDWNFTTESPGSLVCKQQIVGLLGIHNCVSQWFNFIYTPRHTHSHALLNDRKQSEKCVIWWFCWRECIIGCTYSKLDCCDLLSLGDIIYRTTIIYAIFFWPKHYGAVHDYMYLYKYLAILLVLFLWEPIDIPIITYKLLNVCCLPSHL